MANFDYSPLLPTGADDTTYRCISTDHVSTLTVDGRPFLKVAPEALTLLAEEAMADVSHLLRPSHLAQLRAILDDPEATSNDRFVALEMIKNAVISSNRVLPMCQDTGTAIVMAKKGQNVWVKGNDEAAISDGVGQTYQESNLRYSNVAPLSMFQEVNTGNNLPAQIDIYSTEGDAYKFLFVAKGGGSANKTFLFQSTPSTLDPERLVAFSMRKSARWGRLRARPTTSPSLSAGCRRS